MHLAPNKTIVEGLVERVTPSPDGFGCEVQLSVKSAKAARGFKDFLGTRKGERVDIFVANAKDIRTGKLYRFTTTLLGGPGGERAVAEKTKVIDH